ncbi:MAG: helix-turn-helix domain-containing protein [Acidobacteriaceae bacterium]|nr:helix-turn-helix domain-containing protein [Acidobacteriaceae bacterium]
MKSGKSLELADARDIPRNSHGQLGPSATGAKEVLESWKEIAVLLKRGVRTVQRWEKEEGLPVHRHRHLRGGTIYALASEIQEWLRARDARPASGQPNLPPSPLIWNRSYVSAQELAARCEAARLRAEKARGHFQGISDEPRVPYWGPRQSFRGAS